MDSLIAASARALAAGDALGALKRVALRDDPPALALRGIAMAQLGEHPRARELLRRAARGFGAHEELARARCVVAEAEVALAMRDLGGSPRSLAAAAATLEARGDHANALQARLIAARRLLLLGRLDEAAAALARLDARGLPPSLAAVAELTAAELALRSLRTGPAQAALARAQEAADRARVPALLAEVAEARRGARSSRRPAPLRRRRAGAAPRRGGRAPGLGRAGGRRLPARPGCRRRVAAAGAAAGAVRVGARARRGVARRCRSGSLDRVRIPHPPPRRDASGAPAGRDRPPARARHGAGRTSRPPRAASSSGRATSAPSSCSRRPSTASRLRWWRCSPMARPGRLRPWRLALGASQRTVQRALVELEAEGRVRSIGRARAQRWLAPPLAGFTTILLLPAALPIE